MRTEFYFVQNEENRPLSIKTFFDVFEAEFYIVWKTFDPLFYFLQENTLRKIEHHKQMIYNCLK